MVLGKDVLTVDVDPIGDTRVEQIWIRGVLSFKREA